MAKKSNYKASETQESEYLIYSPNLIAFDEETNLQTLLLELAILLKVPESLLLICDYDHKILFDSDTASVIFWYTATHITKRMR